MRLSLDPSQSRGALMSQLMAMCPDLSVSRAGRLAGQIQEGTFVGDPQTFFGRLDPTGNEAVHNVMEAAA